MVEEDRARTLVPTPGGLCLRRGLLISPEGGRLTPHQWRQP